MKGASARRRRSGSAFTKVPKVASGGAARRSKEQHRPARRRWTRPPPHAATSSLKVDAPVWARRRSSAPRLGSSRTAEAAPRASGLDRRALRERGGRRRTGEAGRPPRERGAGVGPYAGVVLCGEGRRARGPEARRLRPRPVQRRTRRARGTARPPRRDREDVGVHEHEHGFGVPAHKTSCTGASRGGRRGVEQPARPSAADASARRPRRRGAARRPRRRALPARRPLPTPRNETLARSTHRANASASASASTGCAGGPCRGCLRSRSVQEGAVVRELERTERRPRGDDLGLGAAPAASSSPGPADRRRGGRGEGGARARCTRHDAVGARVDGSRATS